VADPFHHHPHNHDPRDRAEAGHLAWHAAHPGQGHLHVHGRVLGWSAHHHRPDPDRDHPAVWGVWWRLAGDDDDRPGPDPDDDDPWRCR
jgi:hypothetical protein